MRIVVCLSTLLIVGCSQGTVVDEPEQNAAAGAEEKPANKIPLLKRKTDKITQFDPAAGRQISDSKVTYSNPITGPLEATGPILEKTTKMMINRSVEHFRAEHGRYPKDMDEFMNRIIKPGGTRLPVLPGGKEYQYDVENHQLVVVEKKQGQ